MTDGSARATLTGLQAGRTTSRRVLLAACALTPVAWRLGASDQAEANTVTIKGRIAQTYARAGGVRKLGAPLGNEVKIRIGSTNTYGQRFARGQVWWARGVGKVDLPASVRVRLDTGRNFRPVLGVRDVYRSDDLDGATALEQRIVRDLQITTVIAMDAGPDPQIAGVQNLSFVISNAGDHLSFYRGYVNRSASRAAIGQVLAAVATSTAPVLLHCAAGKDRTGWTSDLLAALAGVSKTQRDADYLATRRYSGDLVDLAWLDAARAELTRRYGSLDRYLTVGCGLTAATVAALRTRLTPATTTRS